VSAASTIAVAVVVEAPPAERERLLAELYALGSLGLEENDAGFVAYFPATFANEPGRSELLALGDAARHIRVAAPEPVVPQDWEASWRRGLAPRQIGGIWIRPSWCESQGEPELVIDPQQAFGSGEHATTRIALCLLQEGLVRGDRVLDVGSGSGILGLAALRLGACLALGLDLERPACANARENAARNGLPLWILCGTPAALSPRPRYEVVVANMLWAELRPWLARLAAHCQRRLVVSGALEGERARLLEACREEGFELTAERSEAQSGDAWWGGAFERTG